MELSHLILQIHASALRGREVVVTTDTATLTGIALGIAPSGALPVQTRFDTGEQRGRAKVSHVTVRRILQDRIV